MKLVQIQPWRDQVLGLTDTGEVYVLSAVEERPWGPFTLRATPAWPGFPKQPIPPERIVVSYERGYWVITLDGQPFGKYTTRDYAHEAAQNLHAALARAHAHA